MRKKNVLLAKLLWIGIVVPMLVAGCASRQVRITETGFLSSYTNLQEDTDSRGMYVYKNSSVDIAQRYTKILIAPVKFELDPTVKANEINDEDREKLAEYFFSQLEEKLAESYGITDSPGEGVLLLRAAITGLLPNKVYLNLHWSTTLMGAGIGGASLEAELVDSMTNERIASFVDARKGKRLNYTKGLTKWGHTKEVLGIWADVMAENINQLK